MAQKRRDFLPVEDAVAVRLGFCKKTHPLFWSFSVFVLSLSWQVFGFECKQHGKDVFLPG